MDGDLRRSAVSLTPMPGDRGVHELLPNTDPTSGVVTMTPRPSLISWAIGQSLLEALGIRSELFGSGRDHDEDMLVASAWLIAHHIEIVVVRHASIIKKREMLDSLLLLCSGAGAHLALTCDESSGEHLYEWVEQHGHIEIGDRPLYATLAAASRPLTPEDRRQGDEFPRFLPKVDFYLFRARCREVLAADEFAVVDDLYKRVFRDIRDSPPKTSVEAGERIVQLCSALAGPGEVLTTIRAAQAALLTQGALLKVNLPLYMNAVREHEHRRLNPGEIRALRGCRQPWRSAMAVLRDANLSSDDIVALRLQDITDEGYLVPGDYWDLSSDARVYLRAQRLLRSLEGASESDRFIDVTPPSMILGHRRIAIELGLPGYRAREATTSTTAQNWKNAVGASLTVLQPSTGQWRVAE